MKFIFLSIFLAGVLSARINPFEPVVKPVNIQKVKPVYFKKATIYLPNDARILKDVIFVYQTVNSDIKQKIVNIDKNIDFHSPFILTHSPKNFGFINSNFRYFTLYIKNKSAFLKTKDKCERTFFLINPFRLVLDFKRKSNIPTIRKSFNSFIKKVIIGSHSNFYRVVLYLDANYNYKIKKMDDGVKIDFY
ncbi:AMIN domain-containing protein [Caminibacter profundus]